MKISLEVFWVSQHDMDLMRHSMFWCYNRKNGKENKAELATLSRIRFLTSLVSHHWMYECAVQCLLMYSISLLLEEQLPDGEGLMSTSRAQEGLVGWPTATGRPSSPQSELVGSVGPLLLQARSFPFHLLDLVLSRSYFPLHKRNNKIVTFSLRLTRRWMFALQMDSE